MRREDVQEEAQLESRRLAVAEAALPVDEMVGAGARRARARRRARQPGRRIERAAEPLERAPAMADLADLVEDTSTPQAHRPSRRKLLAPTN